MLLPSVCRLWIFLCGVPSRGRACALACVCILLPAFAVYRGITHAAVPFFRVGPTREVHERTALHFLTHYLFYDRHFAVVTLGRPDSHMQYTR